MDLSRPAAVVVLIAGAVSGVPIIVGFLAPNWTFDTIGVVPFVGAIIVICICAAISMRSDILGMLRSEG
jgi:hypothetical protein